MILFCLSANNKAKKTGQEAKKAKFYCRLHVFYYFCTNKASPRKHLAYLTNTGLFHTGIIIIHYKKQIP